MTPVDPAAVPGVLRDRDAVIVIDRKQRTYLRTLRQGRVITVRGNAVSCDEIIGRPEGSVITSARGERLLVLRPTYAQLIPSLPRQAQPIYPKDVGPILVETDIHPGARVLESGTGSGALTMALCRAVGPEGRVVSYDLRPEFQATAAQNVETYLGKLPEWLELGEGDVREVASTGETFDRVVLDLPEPWGALDAVAAVLPPGGILCGYLPTTVQVQQLVLALPGGGFEHLETFEVLHRSWHVTERSVRPDHRMVAHTGFITVARRVGTSGPDG